MQSLALQDVLIAQALRDGTIEVEACHNPRIDSDYWAIRDAEGTIEVHLSEAAAEQRIGDILERMAERETQHVA